MNDRRCVADVCALFKPTGVCCPHDSCDLEDGTRSEELLTMPLFSVALVNSKPGGVTKMTLQMQAKDRDKARYAALKEARSIGGWTWHLKDAQAPKSEEEARAQLAELLERASPKVPA